MSRIIPFKADIHLLESFDCAMEDVVKTLEVFTVDALQKPGWFECSLAGVDIYTSTFPKKCNNCGKVYQDRNAYLTETVPLNPKNGDWGTIEDQGRIIEYRNCECRSSLVIVTACRRNLTPFGIQCRNYFDICVGRFIEQSQIPPEEAIGLTRVIFREVFNYCLTQKFRVI